MGINNLIYLRCGALLALAALMISISSKAESPSASIRFPNGFLWGAATAAHQVEGRLDNDWSEWEKQPGKIANGDTSEVGVDHYNRFDEDFALAAAMKHNVHRISVEWARIEPQKGQYSPEAIAHYHEVFQSIRKHGMRPMVTLHHFTSPKWVAAQGGWLSPETVDDFARFAAMMGGEYGHEVDLWITINEPNIYSFLTYAAGMWPPQHQNVQEALVAMSNFSKAHARAYHALHAQDQVAADGGPTSSQVGISQHISIFDPLNWWNPLDHFSAYFNDQAFNRGVLKAVTTGVHSFHIPTMRGVETRDPLGENALDFVGINFYTRWLCTGIDRYANPAVPTTPMGWEVYPHGMYRALALANQYTTLPSGRKIPILITENGIDDRSQENRNGYLIEHLKQVASAIEDGMDIRGYVHWTLMDNFEWTSGYSPKFGLYFVDRRPEANLRRIPTPTVDLFRQIVELNGLSTEMLTRPSR